jgi:hypothetical protein
MDSVVVSPVIPGTERKVIVAASSEVARGSVPPTPRAVPSQPAVAVMRSRPDEQAVGRNSLSFTVAAIVLLAIAIGIGIGLGISSSQKAATAVQIDAIPPALVARFQAVQKQLEERRTRGEPVPQRAWELVGEAGAALIEGNGVRADERIGEIERLLKGEITKK